MVRVAERGLTPAASVGRIGLAALAAIALGCTPRPGGEVLPPNVLLVVAGSLRPDHLGCYGYPRGTSPAIDRLAAEGVLVETVTSSSSWTLPALAALSTGLPDSVHGLDRPGRSLPPRARTLAEALRSAGYRTAAVGTSEYLDPRFGLDQGFDRYQVRTRADDDGRWTREQVDELLRLPPPFFLLVHLEAGLPAQDGERAAALYDREVARADRQIGRIVERLADRGRAADTLLVVTSDHGEELIDDGRPGPRRTLFEESVRIPLLFHAPGRLAAGVRLTFPAGITDVAPTILDLARAEPLPAIAGLSLAPWIRGREIGALPAAPRRTTLSELVEQEDPERSLLAVRTAGWKVIVRRPGGEPVGLWNLAADPGERRSLVGLDPRLAAVAEAEVSRAEEALGALGQVHPLAGSAPPGLPEEVRARLVEVGHADTPPPVATAALWAVPNPVPCGADPRLGRTRIFWDVGRPGALVEVRLSTPDGPLFARGGERGSAETGEWLSDGLEFFVVERNTGEVLGSTVVDLAGPGCAADRDTRPP